MSCTNSNQSGLTNFSAMETKFSTAEAAVEEAEFRSHTEGAMQIFEHDGLYTVAPYRANRRNVLETVR